MKNEIISGLWVQGPLNELALLTVRSFVAFGYSFHLYSYDIESIEPELGMEVLDANLILTEKHLFQYRHTNHFGHGKGSYAGFSDIFRYKLLYEQGGWWSDMDITCIQPLPSGVHYYFRAHHELALVGNLMKCPKGSELMKNCFEQSIVQVTAENKDWHLPIQILIKEVKHLNLTKYIVAHRSNTDDFNQLKPLIFTTRKAPLNWRQIHWQNEVWRSQQMTIKQIKKGSFLYQLLLKYQILKEKPNSKFKSLRFPIVFIAYVFLSLLIGEQHPFSRFPMYDNLPNWAYSFEVQDTSGNLISCKSLHMNGSNLNHWYGHFCEQRKINYGYWYETPAQEKIVGKLMAKRIKQLNPGFNSFQIIKKHYFLREKYIHCDTVLLFTTKQILK